MATPLAVGDVVNVVFATRLNLTAQLGMWRSFYRVTAAGTATYEDLAQDIYNFMRDSIAGWLPAGIGFTGVGVTRQKKNMAGVDIGKAGPFKFRSVTNGTSTGTVLPGQASAMLRWTCTALPLNAPPLGSAKGRSYIPWVSVANYNTGTTQLLGVGVAKLTTVGQRMGPVMAVALKGATLQMVLRRTNAPPAPDEPRPFAGWADVTKGEAQPLVATQRRRGEFGQVNAAF